ncbi:roadblock/LC7 domain-containing protein [Kitasatospora sp. NPDC018614]|uniref:roadblock/LC7 domain-containing protein n=1 Tax=Kitasatospora sp. NPDC018614 TaxID=3364026 RepID=UPI00378F09E0
MNPEIQNLLDQRVGQIAHVLGAVVVTEDGIFRYMSGWTNVAADPSREKSAGAARRELGEHLAAMTSSMATLAQRQADYINGGHMLRTVVETEKGWCVASRAGNHCVIAVHASKEATLGQLGFELTDLAGQLGSMLDVEQRELATGEHGGTIL